ncbi:sulfotransferase [Maricaulis sp.]|uniref:sulfotransferase n=1 Tax=Maricaulis sp. TaxID=1486257 RepID=UPI002631EE31|nr:sulfotransferase [Maricaulis sp.]
MTDNTTRRTGDVDALIREAAVQRRAGRMQETIGIYRDILRLRPDLTDYWFDLALLLRQAGQPQDALEAYNGALANGIRDPQEVHLNRAVILSDDLQRDGEAKAALEAALAADPEYGPARLNLGNLHEERGERDEALAQYTILAEKAGRAGATPGERELGTEALSRISHLAEPAYADERVLLRLKEAIEDAGLPVQTRANAAFALGRALDAAGEPERAFAAIDTANSLARQGGPAYDPARTERFVEALIAATQAPARRAVPEERGALQPVFICGLFRSGSTLIERVLAAHDTVTAGGELAYLPRLAATALSPFPATLAALDDVRASEFARGYQAHLEALFPEAAAAGGIVIDKRPDNFLLIGLIKRLFPGAKIVHTVRHPLDTGLSVYFQHLDQRVAGYSSDLAAIGHYFGQYRRLMAHWKRLWPDSIFDLDYDHFVVDPQTSLRSLFGFLDLEWDAACLDFHERPQTVRTASYWQVRRPLYRSASGRWRPYGRQLEPLRHALLAAGLSENELA